MSLISIRSFRFTHGDFTRKRGDVTVKTVASATLAIDQKLIDRKHFAVNLTSLVPEDGDCVLVKVYAKTRYDASSGKLDEFIEFPSCLVNATDGTARKDIAHPITKQMRDVCTNLVWNEVRKQIARRKAAAA